MKIESSVDKTLDNGAVLLHLQELIAQQDEKRDHAKSKKHASDKPKDDYEAVTSKVTDYFTTAISQKHLPNYNEFPKDHMLSLMTQLKKFELVKSEMLMLANLKPRDAVFLDCIVEELDDRHPDAEDQGQILDIVNSALSEKDQPEEEDQRDDADGNSREAGTA